MENLSKRLWPLRHYLIPLAVFGLFFAGVMTVAAERGRNPVQEILLTKKWDINHYKTITTDGYIIYECTGRKGYNKGEICGNPGWWPGWPVIAKPLYLLTGDVHFTYAFLAVTFSLAAFILIFHLVLTQWGLLSACFGTASLACFPGSFYLLTGFPYAFLLTVLLLYILLFKNRYAAFILAFIAGVSYPSAVLFALYPTAILIKKVIAKDFNPRSCADIIVFRILPFALGPLAFFTYFWITQGDLMLHMRFQSQPRYARSWSWPWEAVWSHLRSRKGAHAETVSFLSAMFALALFGTRRLGAGLWTVTAGLVLLSPSTGSLLSVFRHYLIVFPLHMLVGISSRPWIIKLLFLVVMASLNRQFILTFVYGRLV